MKRIDGIEKVEQLIGRWSPNDLALVEGLELATNPEHTATSMVIHSLFQLRADHWPNFGETMFRVKLRFDDVTALTLNGFGGGPNQVMGFDIRFVGDRGLERINFEVEDYEDGRLHFFCGSVSVLSAVVATD